MNIKLKATLITIAIPLIAVALVYTIVQYPLIIVFTVFGGLLYTVYNAVLNYLKFKEKSKPR
jgi:phosphatidylglycerophosphate synthase